MRKIAFWAVIFSALAFSACEKEDNPVNDEKDVIIQQEDQDRVKTDNAGVVSSYTEASLKSTAEDEELASDMPLVLVAEVDPLEHDGMTIRATHVALDNGYAYVSYNYEGDRYLGGVDVIDVNDPDHPVLVGSVILPQTDLSSVAYSNGTLLFAGATQSDQVDELNPACVFRVNLNNQMVSGDGLFVDLPGYVGTDVAVGSQNYYPISGSNGVLQSYSLSEDILQNTVSLADLRAVGVNDDKVVVLSGSEGIHVYNAADLSEVSSISTSSDVAGKRTIDFYNGNVLASEGYNGVGIYNLSSGDKVTTIPVADASTLDVDPDEVVVNAVSVNAEHIFVANGAAGVSVLSINSGDIADLNDFGSLDLPGSANYVLSKDEYVFVADGFGGLQILKMITVDEATESNCTDYSAYDGKKNLTINSDEDLGYSGAGALDKIQLNSNSSLYWCGSLAVSQHVIINNGSELTIHGSMAQGSGGQQFIINSGGTLNVEGSLVIYGDLMLNSESTINFLGQGSSITIYGSVTNNGNVTITGDYDDTENKLSN